MSMPLACALLFSLLFSSHTFVRSQQQNVSPSFYSLAGFLNYASSSIDYLSQSVGLVEMCPFREDMSKYLKEHLPLQIQGQDEGLEIITNAIAGWDFKRKSGSSQPLVLAVTGSTGVGKSETSFKLAEGVFAKSTRSPNTKKHTPNGLLTLRGEDYSENSEAGSLGLGEVHRRIRHQIVGHLKECAGKAVIVFDEVQKVMPGTLDVLMPALEERGSISIFGDGSSSGSSNKASGTSAQGTSSKTTAASKTHTYSTSNCIFVFISDIGSESMIKLLLEYDDRKAIPQGLLRTKVRQALDEQWARLQFGKVISEVVPFLPMEQHQVQQVLSSKLDVLSSENKFTSWLELVVDEDVQQHLTGSQFLKYFKHSVKPKPNAKNSTNANANLEGKFKVFAKYGARALEAAGPLRDLESLLARYMQPWRSDQVLHVGLADPTDVRLPNKNSKKQTSVNVQGNGDISSTNLPSGEEKEIDKNMQLYFQWCKFHESMIVKRNTTSASSTLATNSNKKKLVVPQTLAFSAQCETIHVASLV